MGRRAEPPKVDEPKRGALRTLSSFMRREKTKEEATKLKELPEVEPPRLSPLAKLRRRLHKLMPACFKPDVHEAHEVTVADASARGFSQHQYFDNGKWLGEQEQEAGQTAILACLPSRAISGAPPHPPHVPSIKSADSSRFPSRTAQARLHRSRVPMSDIAHAIMQRFGPACACSLSCQPGPS